MDTDSFIVYIKTNDIYKEIAEYVETKFVTLNRFEQTTTERKNKKVTGVIEDE